MNLNVKFDIKTIIILVLLLLLVFGGFYHTNMMSKKNDMLTDSENLTKALNDTIRTYVKKNGDVVSEKRTIQIELGHLKNENLVLTENQKKLIKAIDEINKKNQVIAAAVIEMGVKIGELTADKPLTVTDSTITFKSTPNSDSIKYTALVGNVTKYRDKTPYFKLTNFEIKNTQTVDFKWKDDKKEGYPVTFSVTNSNPYFKTYDIDSFVIPEIDKNKLKPTFWRKLGTFTTKTGGKIVLVGSGLAVGYLLAK